MRFGVKLGKKTNKRIAGGIIRMKKSSIEKDPHIKAILMLFIYLVIGVVIGLIISYGSLAIIQRRIGNLESVQLIWHAFSTNFIIETIIISMNLTLLLGLLWSYKKDFRQTQSPFLLGLILFLLVLVFQSLLSLPVLDIFISIITIGARQGIANIFLTYQSAIFSIIAHFFETIALIILFHLSNE
jgi:hypothetical protein